MTLWTTNPAMTYSGWADRAQPTLNEMAIVLHDWVRVGSNLCEAIQAEHATPDNTMNSDKLVAVLLLRNVLAQADAIALLIEARAGVPCATLLRTLLENYLSLRWLCTGDRLRKARAYAVTEKLRLLHLIRSSIPGRPEYTRLHAEASTEDLLHRVIGRVPLAEAKQQEQQLSRELDTEPLKSIADELLSRKRRAPWYSIGGGPTDLRTLAKRLGMLGEYESLYRHWSSDAHGNNALRGLEHTNEGRVGVAPIRLVEGLPGVFHIASTMTAGGCNDLVISFGSQQLQADLRYTYVAHIRERVQKLARITYTAAPAPTTPLEPT